MFSAIFLTLSPAYYSRNISVHVLSVELEVSCPYIRKINFNFIEPKIITLTYIFSFSLCRRQGEDNYLLGGINNFLGIICF